MKIAVIVVVIVVCVGLTMAHPLRQSLLGLGRLSKENDSESDDNQPTEESAKDTVTNSQQIVRPGSNAEEGRAGWKGTTREKRQFSDASNWNSFRSPDRYFDPIHLQNWGSQFGRSYRKFDGIQPGRRLRPVSGVYENGDPILHGGDSLQNWRALYSEDHF